MGCRKHLLRLAQRGALVLPALRRQRPVVRRSGTAVVCPEVRGELADLGTVTLQRIGGGTAESALWNALMDRHHPQRRGPLCGGQIRYLIRSERHGVLGGLAVSAAAWRLRARDAWLGWDDATCGRELPGIVCNSRFLILPTVRVQHLASHVLGQLRRRIGRDWQESYGVTPWLMETCVAATQSGTAYRAANWIEVGMTAGRGRQDRRGTAKLPVKRVFLYPLCRARLKRLCGRRARPEAGWLQREFAGAKLGDRRLERRLLELAGAFFTKPQANIPQACGSLAATKAAYRFFDHKRTTMDVLLGPHRQATIDRMRHEALVLVAQDTSSLNYTTHHDMEGIGPIGTGPNGPQGVLLHSALAFRPDGLPLGILDAQCWARDADSFGQKKDRAGKPITEKESYKWISPLGAVRTAVKQCPATRIIVLADREADIYEYMLEARDKNIDVLVRAKEDRALAKNKHRLWHAVTSQPPAGSVELAVPRRGKQAKRVAQLSLRFAEVALAPPTHKPGLPAIRVWAVCAREDAPPTGIKPLEWMLLTSVPVASLSDAIGRVQWYAARWGIEVFHRILKSGCRIEDRQLGSDDRLEACLAIDMVVAWRIHYLTWLGRASPEVPCTVVFDDDQWKALMVFRTKQLPPDQPPTLRLMILYIAQLGGFLGRKSDGQPGSQTLWRGIQHFDDIAAAFRSFKIAYRLPP
ncbi:MAG TPA: IS4 family transposase [Stellaceae bacterium]|nr:IS4 family transposase [Stellaceae bacterium]